MFNKKQGFTLIELLVVIAIIAILASIALLSLAPAQKAGRDARRIADLRNTQSVLQLYYNKCGFFPNASAAISTVSCGANSGSTSADSSGNYVAYASWSSLDGQLNDAKIISQPLPDDPAASGNAHYAYAVTTDAAGYVVGAKLESDNGVLKNSFKQDVLLNLDCNTADLNADGSPNYTYCIAF